MLDAYHQCLGIARGQETPTWYQLLGVAVTERDPSVLEQAAVTRSSQVRVYQLVRTPETTWLLNQIAQALATLLDPVKRKEYDARLKGVPAGMNAGRRRQPDAGYGLQFAARAPHRGNPTGEGLVYVLRLRRPPLETDPGIGARPLVAPPRGPLPASLRRFMIGGHDRGDAPLEGH
jgi:hypothetical protein